MKHLFNKLSLLTALVLVIGSLSAQNQIIGVVTYHGDSLNPLPNIVLDLMDSNNGLVATTVTNNIGEFNFTNVPTGEFTFEPSTTIPVGDINLIDASLILQELNGTYQFNEFESKAADVNGSGNVTYGDYIITLNSYLAQGNPFPTDEWQFEEVSVTFTARDSGTTKKTTVWATATGDVEGEWLPGGRNIYDPFSSDQYLTEVNNQEIELVIGSDYNELIGGFHLNFVYPIGVVDIIDVIGPDENFHYDIDEATGELSAIWLDENDIPGEKFFGKTLFRVIVKQNESAKQFDEGVFSLLNEGMVLDSKLDIISNITINLPKLSAGAKESINLEAVSYPNPVTNSLNIKISCPENDNAKILIYDLQGKLIRTETSIIYKGTQLIHINTQDLHLGHYFYMIQLQNDNNLHGRFQKLN
jgi:type IX secretion system substrate protein